MKAMTKSELAAAAGVSPRTLQRWLAEHRDELATMGVKPTAHLLPPIAVRYVVDQYGIDVD